MTAVTLQPDATAANLLPPRPAAPAPAGRAPISLRRNFAFTLAGNALYAACQWGILVVLAKLGSPAIVGKYALAMAVCSPVILFSNLQLREIQATDARRDHAFGDYLALRILCTILALA